MTTNSKEYMREYQRKRRAALKINPSPFSVAETKSLPIVKIVKNVKNLSKVDNSIRFLAYIASCIGVPKY